MRAPTSTEFKKASILIAWPLESKQYLVVFLQLKYGKFKKFPVSSCDFNSICFGNISAFQIQVWHLTTSAYLALILQAQNQL